MTTLRVHSISLGCPKTRVDSECLLGSLGARVVPAASPFEADLVFVNTCSFITPAVQESVRAILDAADVSVEADPRPLVAVAGCLVSRFGASELAAEMPEVDLWLPLAEAHAWPARIAAALAPRGFALSPAPGRLRSTAPSFAYLKVSEGCDHACAFCTIPSIRGPLRSRPRAEVVADARAMLDDGASELVLVAQDLTAYGRDLKSERALEGLLEELAGLRGLTWLRLMYLYPAGLSERFLDFLSGVGEPLVPYFDVPLQHASPSVLSRMGRPFAGDPMRVVSRIRSRFPGAALRTSLIVGFPGETEADVALLADFVREARFTNLGVFAYCAEEGTPAATMPDQVADELRQERRDRIMELQAEISEDFLETFLNTEVQVLVDEPHPDWPGLYVGRTWFQAPEVDGVTYVSGPGVQAGALVTARVEEASAYDLVTLVDPEEGET